MRGSGWAGGPRAEGGRGEVGGGGWTVEGQRQRRGEEI